MKLYIANCTKQHCDFHYSVRKGSPARRQNIQAGRQVILADQSLAQDEIDFILRQHARFGMVEVGAVSRLHGYTPRIYSIDKLITPKAIEEVMRHNNSVQTIKGKEARKLAGVQAHNAIEAQLAQVTEQTQGQFQPELGELDISIEQHNDPRSPFQPTDETPNPLAEGMLISKTAEPGAPTPGKSRKGKGGGGGKRGKKRMAG